VNSLVTFKRGPWLALAALSLCQLMVALDATVINIALPAAQSDLHFSAGNRQWLITAYALTFGSLLLLGGRLTDLWGRRNAVLIGLVGFAGASALGGMAHSFNALVTARAIQGGFGALLAPAALALVSVTFEAAAQRAKAFVIFGAISASGAAIGLLLGGALTQWYSWRWCLYINLLFAAIAAIGILAFVGGGKDHHQLKLDVVGTVIGSSGLFFLVYGLGHAESTSWTTSATWLSIASGVILLASFVRTQNSVATPLLPLRLLTHRTRAGSHIALFVTSFGMFGLTLFLAYYLENIARYTPLQTGLAFLPLVLAMALSASVASARLLALVGPRPLIPTGLVLSAMGLVLFTRLPLQPNYASYVLPGLIVLGLGIGLIFAPAVASATWGVEKSEAGAASAVVNATQNIGGSVGTALLNSLAVSATTGALVMIHHPTVQEIGRATLHGYARAFWVAAGLFVVGAIVTFVMLDSGVPESHVEILN
jgi:EmrB/QacA subfamily drug resistance transporter